MQVSEQVSENRREQFHLRNKYSFFKMVNMQSLFCLYDHFHMKKYDSMTGLTFSSLENG